MRLVEIDDTNSSTYANYGTRIDDSSYSKPYVMSNLDNAMNEILKASIPDGEKWRLYSQTLQRYLNHSKFSTRNSDISITKNNCGDKHTPFQPAEISFNRSLENFSPLT